MATTPLYCPVCEFVMKTFEDSISYQESKCCSKCQDNWGKEAKYDEPEKLYKIKEYIEKRIKSTKEIMPILKFE